MGWPLPIGRRRALQTAFALALAIGSLALLRERPRRLVEVEPGWLYRSNQLRPRVLRRTLQRLGIDLLVDLTPDRGKRAGEVAVAHELGVTWAAFPLEGNGDGLVSRYVDAIAAIDRAHHLGQQVLVHCYLGKARSGGVVAMYLTLVTGGPVVSALVELQRFVSQPVRDSVVLAYMEEHLPELIRSLDARGVVLQPDAAQRLQRLRKLAGPARREGSRSP